MENVELHFTNTHIRPQKVLEMSFSSDKNCVVSAQCACNVRNQALKQSVDSGPLAYSIEALVTKVMSIIYKLMLVEYN